MTVWRIKILLITLLFIFDESKIKILHLGWRVKDQSMENKNPTKTRDKELSSKRFEWGLSVVAIRVIISRAFKDADLIYTACVRCTVQIAAPQEHPVLAFTHGHIRDTTCEHWTDSSSRIKESTCASFNPDIESCEFPTHFGWVMV